MATVDGTRMDEYLNELFQRAFDREVAQEEKVFNSLSFFVAAMALTINVLGYIATKVPPFRLSAYSLTVYALTILAAFLMAPVMWSLFDGVRQRVYRLPPKETDTLDWADGLRSYHFGSGLRDKALDDAVVEDLRREMLQELALSVVQNRTQNAERTAARTAGISLMVAQLALAFSIVAIIFVHDRFVSTTAQASASHAPTAETKPRANAAAPGKPGLGAQAPAAATPVPRGGG